MAWQCLRTPTKENSAPRKPALSLDAGTVSARIGAALTLRGKSPRVRAGAAFARIGAAGGPLASGVLNAALTLRGESAPARAGAASARIGAAVGRLASAHLAALFTRG